MRWSKRIRIEEDGLDLAADIDAAIAVNHGRPGTTNRVTQASRVAVVQDARRDRGAGEPPQPDPKERR
ncbi:MAG TPA: hypothetical protein VFR49_09375 [Solirubrobacteraceae bacterium]|nr:hypothetical protein [Solirubrobacteraceae bacterium]